MWWRWSCWCSWCCWRTSSCGSFSLSVETPNGVQHLAEMTGTSSWWSRPKRSIIGHGYERFTSYLTALALFILLSNLMGLVHQGWSRRLRADITVPLGLRADHVRSTTTTTACAPNSLGTSSSSRRGCCGGCRGCCFRLRLFRTARVCFRSRCVYTRTCLPAIC